MSLFHSKQDEEALNENLLDICTRRRKVELHYEPTAATRAACRDVVMSFIRDKKRIVYGGYAVHTLVAQKGAHVYTELSYPDVEFYTPDLLGDVRQICNKLHALFPKGNVNAEEGVHPTTFVVRVEFEGVCDITFYPKRFYESVPVVQVDGLRIASPEYMMVDVFRVYAFPISNYFRLTKTFQRANLLLKHFPLGFERKPLSQRDGNDDPFGSEIERACKTQVIHTGVSAHNFFVAEAGCPELVLTGWCRQVISLNFSADVKRISQDLPSSKFLCKYHLPFLDDLLGRRAVFYDRASGRPLLEVVDQSSQCVPFFTTAGEGKRFTTLQGTVFYALASMSLARLNGDKSQVDLQETMLADLIAAKKVYYREGRRKVTDPGPFQEFVVDCIGNHQGAMRTSLLKMIARKKRKMPMRYRYNPSESNNRQFSAMKVSLCVGEPEG